MDALKASRGNSMTPVTIMAIYLICLDRETRNKLQVSNDLVGASVTSRYCIATRNGEIQTGFCLGYKGGLG